MMTPGGERLSGSGMRHFMRTVAKVLLTIPVAALVLLGLLASRGVFQRSDDPEAMKARLKDRLEASGEWTKVECARWQPKIHYYEVRGYHQPTGYVYTADLLNVGVHSPRSDVRGPRDFQLSSDGTLIDRYGKKADPDERRRILPPARDLRQALREAVNERS
jgi:hypothetical protein